MKEQLIKISDNLNKGIITEIEAKEQLLILCSVVKSLKDIQREKFEEWLTTFKMNNSSYWFTDTLLCCRNSMRDKYNELGIGVF